MDTIEINLKDVQPIDLFGQPVEIENLHEILCNAIYKKTGSIRIVDIVKVLFYGNPVQIDKPTLDELIGWSTGVFAPFIESALLTYLNDKLDKMKEE